MNHTLASFVIAGLLCGSQITKADFKYTETAKVTGGAMMGAMKMASIFSKEASAANKPTETTVSLKGNRMRRDENDGKIQIIDLEGRRFIYLDPNARTYSVVSFDEQKAALEKAKTHARAEQPQGEKAPKVTITPKIESSATGNSKTILGSPAKEYKVKMEAEMQTDDPKAKGQTATVWFTSDAWVAPDVKGYEEIRRFYERMAREMGWTPEALMGSSSQISLSMSEFRKNAAKMDGFPLVQYASFGMGAVPPAGSSSAAGAQPGTPATEKSEQAGAGDLKSQAIGSMLGSFGFGKKKKAEPAPPPRSRSASAETTAPPGAFTTGSLMDMTLEVTSFSSNSLDRSLFEIPAGYTQIQPPGAN